MSCARQGAQPARAGSPKGPSVDAFSVARLCTCLPLDLYAIANRTYTESPAASRLGEVDDQVQGLKPPRPRSAQSLPSIR